MKLKSVIILSLLTLGLAGARAQEAAPATAAAPVVPAAPAAKPAFTNAQMLETFGWYVGNRMGLTELEFNADDVESIIKGLRLSAAGKEAPFPLDQVGPLMNQMMQAKQAAFMAKARAKSEAANAAFFTKLKDNKNVVALPSGLRYEIVKQGDGAAPKPSDTVSVNYTGALVDGTTFDASEPGSPAEFQLDAVIPGWTEGIQKVNKGGKIKLYVPPQLGYGEEGKGSIPPSSVLVFEVELLDIKAPAPVAPAMPAPAATPAPAGK